MKKHNNPNKMENAGAELAFEQLQTFHSNRQVT